MAVPIQVIRLGIIGAVIGGFITFKYVAAGMVDDKINGAMLKAGIPTETFTYDNSSVDLLGLNVHLEDVKINIPGQDAVKVDEITINDFDSEHTIPEFLDIEIEGIEAKSNFDALGFGDIFKDMDEVSVDLALNYKFDSEDKILNIKEISQSVDDLGKLSLSTELHNISSLEQLTQQMMMNPYGIAVGKSELEYEDDSLVEKVIAYNAKEAGVPVDEFKSQLLESLNKKLQKADEKEDADLEEKYLSAVIDFIEDPDAFEISINPEKAISFMDLSRHSANENLEKLNLEID